MKKRMKKVIVLLMAAVLAVPGQSLAGAAKMAVVNAQEQETKAVELQSEYFNMTSRYEKVVYSKADHGFYLVKKGDPFYSNQQKFEVSFYDIDSNSYEQKTTILRAEDSFVNDEGIYYIKTKNKKLDSAVEKNGKTYTYDCNATLYEYVFETGETKEITLDSMKSTANFSGFINALGVDKKGRIYVANASDDLCLYDSTGKSLATAPYEGSILQFYGFDTVSGNFYYRGTYNWRYWGYDHDMASFMAGNVGEDNTLHLPEANLMMLYQSYFYERNKPAEMLNDKYLAVLNTFQSPNAITILDSNSYDYNDHTEQSTVINIIDSSVSVSSLNIADKDAIKFVALAGKSTYKNNFDVSSYGTRCALSEDEKSIYVKTDTNTLTQYSMEDGKKKVDIVTEHPVYSFWVDGDICRVVEKEEDQFYLETLDLKIPTTFEVQAPESMKVSESDKMICTTEGSCKMDYTYESSDPNIVSVDETGGLNAWKAGTATITITAETIGVTKQVTITVDGSQYEDAEVFSKVNLEGAASDNIHLPHYSSYYGSTTKSYLAQTADGGYQRAEYINDKIVVETYDSKLNLVSSENVAAELPIFGGIYIGENYNYAVFGQMNKEESDECEVFRFVKYDKNWNRLAQCSVKGANTYIPFDAGGLSMTETDGKLYIHTCHEMYQSDDGYHHQANCSFVVNEEDMTLVDSYTGVMNLGEGYVSHSFMQLIRTDGEYIYRVDLGDAYPRGIAFTMTKTGDKLQDPSLYGSLFTIDGNTGYNYTGYSLTGLELSEEYYLVAGLGVEKLNDDQKNIFISASRKVAPSKNRTWITNYANGADVDVTTPKLVKITKNQFLLMWEEKASGKQNYTTKMMLLNADGSRTSDVYSSQLALSECQPICDTDGNVVWYVTDNGKPVMIKINPYCLEQVSKETGGSVEENTGGNNGGNTGDNNGGNTGGNTGGNISWGDGDIDWDWGFDPKPDNSDTDKTEDSQTKPQKTIKVGKPKITLKRSKTKIQVQFKKVKNAKKYQIQYADNKKFKKAKTKTTTKRNYTIKGLKKNKKYYVRVRGVNGKKKGSWSAVKKK